MAKLNAGHSKSVGRSVQLSKVYIAGKVGDLTDDDYYYEVVRKFDQRERELRKLGYSVVNPMKICKRGMSWPEAMKTCIRALTFCDFISPLPDAKASPGASIEIDLSFNFQMTMVFPSKINKRNYNI
jgi:hypothetical protein